MTQTQDEAADKGYKALTIQTLPDYLADFPDLGARLGGHQSTWQVREVGDGNLNLVFIVSGSKGKLCVKQALPYVRMVGDSWPLPLSRALFEYAALRQQTLYAPRFVPALYWHDAVMALTVMEYLSPHIIMRKGLIKGEVYPSLARHLGEFMALMLYSTSNLHLSAADKRKNMVAFANNDAMCKISEDLIFDEPYYAAPMNRHTSGLDDIAQAFQNDITLKEVAQEMKWRFLNHAEALLHGDLHTGSVMVTADETRVIDPEFAFYGPMGFDVGMLIANFLMAAFAQEGQAEKPKSRQSYAKWILAQTGILWDSFAASFTQLWKQRNMEKPGGEVYRPLVVTGEAPLQQRLDAIWTDAVGFAGVEIIRRILGLAHVADFESIADNEKRAACERQALLLARDMLVNRVNYPSAASLVEQVLL